MNTTSVTTVKLIPMMDMIVRIAAPGWPNFKNVGGIGSQPVLPLIVLQIFTHDFIISFTIVLRILRVRIFLLVLKNEKFMKVLR